MIIEFEWDETKNAGNLVKHGVSFNEAKAAFFDPLRVDLYDLEHSAAEDRWKVFGLAGCVLLMVSYTETAGVIRVISARRATKTEEEAYFYGYSTYHSN
jgi:uncharacterized DUF497 family protein